MCLIHIQSTKYIKVICRISVSHYNGRSGGIRTPDPLVPNQMRYQAALHSEYLLQIKQQLSFITLELRIIPWSFRQSTVIFNDFMIINEALIVGWTM